MRGTSRWELMCEVRCSRMQRASGAAGRGIILLVSRGVRLEKRVECFSWAGKAKTSRRKIKKKKL